MAPRRFTLCFPPAPGCHIWTLAYYFAQLLNWTHANRSKLIFDLISPSMCDSRRSTLPSHVPPIDTLASQHLQQLLSCQPWQLLCLDSSQPLIITYCQLHCQPPLLFRLIDCVFKVEVEFVTPKVQQSGRCPCSAVWSGLISGDRDQEGKYHGVPMWLRDEVIGAL